MGNQIIKSFFQPGGSLPADSPTYIKRKSDDLLYNHLIAGKFCYVLTARQMGKSSMRVQVAQRLKTNNVSCVNIDLSSIGSLDTTSGQWYYSLLSKTCRDLNLQSNLLSKWWGDNQNLAPANRFSTFFEQILLKQISGNIVIFIDEIDSILSLDRSKFSTDDFFAVIRHCYNSRVDDPDYNRLTFALMGVAAANDLMQEPSRTPFNIGYNIDLESFDYAISEPLLNGLKGHHVESEKLLISVLNWTNGQPYLTQKLCHSLVSNSEIIADISVVDNHVEKLFFSKKFDDHNIQNVNNRILLHDKYNIQMLETIQYILNNNSIKAEDSDFTQIYLRLSGLVNKTNNQLVIGNQIYKTIFNKQWLKNALGKIRRPFAEAMQKWIELGKPKSAALRGEVLDQAIEWSNQRTDITPAENEFLNFSKLIRQEEREEKIELLYTKRLKSRNRILIFALIFSLLAGVLALFYAFEAKKEKNRALTQEKITISSLKKFKQSLILMDQLDHSRIWLIEYLYQNKPLCDLLKKIPTEIDVQSRFNTMLDELSIRSKQFFDTIEKKTGQKSDKFTQQSEAQVSDDDVNDDNNKKVIIEKDNRTDKTINFNYLPRPIPNLFEKEKTLDDFEISTETKKKNYRLIELILVDQRLNEKEKQHLYNTIPLMPEDQIKSLYKTLDTGKNRLLALDHAYETVLEEIEAKMYHNESIEKIKKRIIDIENKNYDKVTMLNKLSSAINEIYTRKISWKNLSKKNANDRLNKNPNDLLALIFFKNYYKESKDYKELLHIYKKLYLIFENYLEVIKNSKVYDQYASLLLDILPLAKEEMTIEILQKFEKSDLKHISNRYLNISWYQLIAKKFEEAILTSIKGLKIDPNNLHLYTNLSHGYLLSNQFLTAKQIYLKFKDKELEGKAWNDIIIKDFKDLKEKGVSHEKMIEITNLLSIK